VDTFLSGPRTPPCRAVCRVAFADVKHDVFAKEWETLLMGVGEGVPVTDVTTSAPGIHKAAGAPFVGGQTFVRARGGPAHVAIALSAPAAGSAQAHALGVLQALLGSTGAHGGAAGAVRLGPQGHSRLARSVHTESHSFIRSLAAFAFPYSDAGLFGIAGSCADHEAGRLAHAIVAFLKDAATVPVTATELARARATYKLAVATDVESRVGGREDLAHQVSWKPAVTEVGATLKAIDAVTAADVQAVAKSLLSSPPAISAIGSLATVPRFDQVAALLK